MDWASRGSNPDRDRRVFFPLNVQAGSGAHPASDCGVKVKLSGPLVGVIKHITFETRKCVSNTGQKIVTNL
jgi:hypothetical protein